MCREPPNSAASPEPVRVDYSGLFSGVKSPSRVLAGRSRFSLYWREISRGVGRECWPTLEKVKAD
eukprot:7212660-Pyramimonas_sp.AAC.1